jgi:CheY-like chemotaxis protein
MIEQVILNLAVNARDAMSKGGKLRIQTSMVHFDDATVTLNPDARPGDFVCMSVTDTGTGIPPEIMPRIFEPFFTTKGVGKGTGLGLATVYGIVQQHQGWVSVSSRVNEGTTFNIFLPAVSPPSSSGSTTSQSLPRGGTEKIFLVEDEEAVRSMTRRALESFGYQVIEAASGQKALDLWEADNFKFDLLLTDIIMPDGLNGRELSERLRNKIPELKAIFVSGYSLNVIGKDLEFLKQHNNHFLQKPYQCSVLIDTIRRCLDGAMVAA